MYMHTRKTMRTSIRAKRYVAKMNMQKIATLRMGNKRGGQDVIDRRRKCTLFTIVLMSMLPTART